MILLDVMLPRVSGIDVCRQIRATSRVPDHHGDGQGSEIDAVVGLEVGADDYVAKPFRLRELVARVRAALRRGHQRRARRLEREDFVEVGDVLRRRRPPRGHGAGRARRAAAQGVRAARAADAQRRRVLTRDVLIDRIWGPNYFGDTKTLDVHIKRLRAKVEDDPSNPTRIVTVRGVGYRYERT